MALFFMLLNQAGWAQFPSLIKLSEMNSQQGLVISNSGDSIGNRVTGIGDVNNDGIDDLIITRGDAIINGQNVSGSFVLYGSAAGFLSPFELNDINGNNGFAINFDLPNGGNAFTVNGKGDINNDGIDDLIIGAPSASLTNTFAGAAYVVFGQSQNFPDIVNLSALDGTNGFVLTGVNTHDNSGVEIKIMADFNNDQIDDLVIGTPGAEADVSEFDTGAVHVVFGSNQVFPSQLNLGTLNGNNGFTIFGEENFDFLGENFSAADINHDGLSDLLLSSDRINDFSEVHGQAYVVFGSTTGFSSIFDLSTLDGSNGFSISSVDVTFPNTTILNIINTSDAGDINGDGMADMLITYPTARHDMVDYAGAVYVIYGSQQPFPAAFDLNGINGTNGFKMFGLFEFDYLGLAANSVKDINNDGVDDITLISRRRVSPNIWDPFITAFVVFGNSAGFPAIYDPSVVDGNNGFAIESFDGTASDLLSNVSSAGDINHDGIGDLVTNGINNGYVIYGKGDLIYQNGFE